MDRNVVIGFVLIGLVLMIWLWMNAPPPPQSTSKLDSLAVNKQVNKIDTSGSLISERKTTLPTRDTLGRYFLHLKEGKKKTLIIETDHYRAKVSTMGGAIHSWELTQYKTWDNHPVNLINKSDGGEFNLLFCSSDGKLISTKDLFFESNYTDGQIIKLSESDSFATDFYLNIDKHSRIVKTLIFRGDLYSYDVSLKFEGMANIISNFAYQATWETGLRYMEYNSVDESNYAKAFALVGGELPEIDATSFNEVVKDSNISGRVTWVATRNKYFALAIIPRGKDSQRAYLEGIRTHLPDEGVKENYSIAIEMPFTGRSLENDRFTIFMGPLDFDIVKRYNVGLEKIMSLGAAWIIRPISEYVIIPLFKFLRLFIPNYGVVLIIFSFIVKIVLHPLSKTSMKSMQKMQALQPMINEIKEKYKEDPQKMNKQVMRLYKEYGVNPAGGCLPLLLQLPILYALWAVFSSAIQLRQASFIWWIHDLSIPDVVARLPFKIPIFNINEISGLALLMGITMLIQQKMSVKDPRQKMMVWLMPILMTLMFTGFPSGLNLYYFVFNLLSIGQQAWINKQHKNEPLRKVEQKKSGSGFISRIAKDLPLKK